MYDTVLTPEEITKNYNSSMDSVNLINELMSFDSLTDEQILSVKRNAEHLELMLSKDYWTTEDLDPFTKAVATAGNRQLLE